MKIDEGKNELDDNSIIESLKDAIEMYENGEILEVHDLLLEIVNSIEEFHEE